MKKKNITIPKLPRGMGTMSHTKDDTIEYKKMVTLPDTRKVRKTVHGDTPMECIKNGRVGKKSC